MKTDKVITDRIKLEQLENIKANFDEKVAEVIADYDGYKKELDVQLTEIKEQFKTGTIFNSDLLELKVDLIRMYSSRSFPLYDLKHSEPKYVSNNSLADKLSERTEELIKAKEELSELKSRGFWARVFNR